MFNLESPFVKRFLIQFILQSKQDARFLNIKIRQKENFKVGNLIESRAQIGERVDMKQF
jgi:hypothetical protein